MSNHLSSGPLQPAVFYRRLKQCGALRLSGADRLAFLQRQSTNDVLPLSAESSVLTVLTNPAARILDVLRLLADSDSLLALPLPGHAENTANYLKSRIFFMDKVVLEDVSGQYAHLELGGLRAAAALAALAVERAPGLEGVAAAPGGLRVIGQPGPGGSSFRLLLPAAGLEAAMAALLAVGALPLDAAAYEVLRIEAGLPAAGAELIGDYTPLEVGLEAAISSSKGCYTGQEVIARQITYDKVTQRLCGLRLKQPGQPGMRVWAEQRPVGSLTSAAVSPRLGPIALAVLRRPFFEAGVKVWVGEADDGQIAAQVAALPFTGLPFEPAD